MWLKPGKSTEKLKRQTEVEESFTQTDTNHKKVNTANWTDWTLWEMYRGPLIAKFLWNLHKQILFKKSKNKYLLYNAQNAGFVFRVNMCSMFAQSNPKTVLKQPKLVMGRLTSLNSTFQVSFRETHYIY